MKPLLLAAGAVALTSPLTLAAPAEAQNRNYNQQVRECNRDLRRADSRAEYRRELRQCQRDLQRAQRQDARDWRRYSAYDYNRFEPGQRQYYADRYYRDGRYYSQRRLSYNDRIYRGQNGNYYCRRNDGTTGLIVGAGIGALLGNQINIGGSSTLRTIAGGALGAALGQAITRGDVRCN